MAYVVSVVRRFTVKADGRVFDRELCKAIELPVRPVPR